MNRQMNVTTTAEGIAAAAKAASRESGGLPPVHLWDPPYCGDLDIRIARDGNWFYLGTPIGRPEMVRLFSTILKKEKSDYFLVTPVEKIGIIVDDAPFVAVDFTAKGRGRKQVLTFTTNVGDSVTADDEHRIRVHRDKSGEPSPYVMVRGGLEALIDRKSFYRLIERGSHNDGWFGIWSSGSFFRIIPSDELPEGEAPA